MGKVLIVLRNEIYALISRRSFWFGVLGVPAIAFLIYSGIAWINRREVAAPTPGVGLGEILSEPEDNRPRGYVDQAGLIIAYPEQFSEWQLIGYANEKEARQSLDAGTISAYFVIPPDFIDSGDIRVVTQEFNLFAAQEHASPLFDLIDYNLLGGDDRLATAFRQPLLNLEKVNVSPAAVEQPVRDKDNEMTFFLPYAVMMLFYVAIMGSSGLLLNSVAKEKENRILEILLVSFDAQHLLLGKIAGLGLVGLFQMVIWGSSALALLRLSGQTFNLSEAFQLDPSIAFWGIIFFILGYLVYATLMAGIGALVPNLREASQATTIIILPMMVPLFLISALIEAPNSVLSTVLSIFPFTAPTTMMLRLAATPSVPLWQILLAILLLIATAYLTIRTVAGFFRAQTMLSGQPFNIKRFALAMLGKG